MAANPLLDLLRMPGEYFRGAVTFNPGERLTGTQFNEKLGIPSNLVTDTLSEAIVDPFTIGGTALALGTKTGRRLSREAIDSLFDSATARRLAKSEAGSLRKPGRMTLQGEYWLDETGFPTFADGDVGDFNHEAIARMHAQRQVMQKHPTLAHMAEAGDDELDFEQFMRKVGKEYDLPTGPRLRERTNPSWLESDSPDDVNMRQNIERMLSSLGVEEHLWDVAAYGNRDARKYATQVWDWTRLAKNQMEVHGLTSSKLKRIARGISDVAEGMDDDEYARQVLDIWDHKTGTFYEGVPIDVLDAGDMKELSAYAQKIR